MGRAATGVSREVSPQLVGMIFLYVERAAGREALDGLLAGLEGAPTLKEAMDPNRWYAVKETVRIARMASELCGDDDIGRRTGEELFHRSMVRGTREFLIAKGSVGAACRASCDYASRMSSSRPVWVEEAADDVVVLRSKVSDPSLGDRLFCRTTAGYYAQLPSLFGQIGAVAETECQFRGDDHCTFRLSWRPDGTATRPAADAAQSARRSEGMVGRFEELQNMASELVGADDVDDVLERIIRLVSRALAAPRYLLAARVHDADRLRVHSSGFDDERAAVASDKVLRGELAEDDGVLVVDIASARRSFGRLAAFFPRGSGVTDTDRRLLGAYAGHAAAALEVISSLELARRDRDTARALLDLAAALAEVGTVQDISDRLRATVPAVVDSDVAGVWLFDHSTGQLTSTDGGDLSGDPRAASGMPAPTFDVSTLPSLEAMVARPNPVLLAAANVPKPLRPMFDGLHLTQAAVVPIISKGNFLGVVSAGFRRELSHDAQGDVFTRLAGLASHAATALENAELLESARHDALHDRLTGLPNRSLVEEQGRQAFAASARTGRGVGLLFVDLDRFKNVNDTLGHGAGDDLIVQVGERMQSVMRASDVLARLGGDEFVVLIPDLVHGEADAVAIAERVIQVLREPFAIGTQELFISCSIGIACAPEHGSDYESLLQYGDAAMYAAKGSGRGRFAIHAVADDAPRRRQLELESELHKAIANDELRVLYQPQVDLATASVVGVEALVRWQHPALGLLEPAAFLPLAEETGLVVSIDEWVREQAFAQARVWQERGCPLSVSVNLSTRALAAPELPRIIAAELARSGVAPELIELEVTDRVVMSDELLPPVLEQIKAIGVRLAIDDFGTGSSVISRLQRCPIDTLKIDRSFVDAVTEDSTEAPLVKAMIALAHSLELVVVAEGVETAAQEATLRRYGCDVAQGFLFSAAVTVEAIDALMRSATLTA